MRPLFAALLFACLTSSAHAWWNPDWSHRSRVVLDTTPQGVETKEPVQAFALALRLHSGNFDFVAARPDGSDLRVLAADDKTPLAFRIERWDANNELAVVWIQVPTLAAGSDRNVVHVYAGNDKAPAEVGNATGFDGPTFAALHFAQPDAPDAISGAKPAPAPALDDNGLLGAAMRANGVAAVWPASDKLRTPAGGALTLSAWVKPEGAVGTLLQQGPLWVLLQGGRLVARIGGTTLTGPEIPAGAWAHVALVLSQGKATLFVAGAPAVQADVATPLIEGPLRVGEGLTGWLDAVQLAATARTPAWLALAASSQGAGSKLVRATIEDQGAAAAEGGSHDYLGILVRNLTVDAWVVILICIAMFVVAVWVMVTKALFINRTDRSNRGFLHQFRDAKDNLLELVDSAPAAHAQSSLFRLYSAGVRELRKRDVGHGAGQRSVISGASLDAVKAAVDADMVRETHRLNGQMVLLTIAISGGPFLGLLGTVVGVMVTFAAIAAAGDVNVNAIAPGIAAALLATVAGLGVAIPALFGYNYLASRIKNISADMQIFVDEFITRVAEVYGAR